MLLGSKLFFMYPDIPSRHWAIRRILVRIQHYEFMCSYSCCLLPTPSRLWQGFVCIFGSGRWTSLPCKNYWQFIMCGDFNDFCTDNVIAECNLTQINFEPTHNKKSSRKVFSFLTLEDIDSSNRFSDCLNRPRFSIMFFADSQEWKKSLLFRRTT